MNLISLLLLEDFEGEICSLVGLPHCDVNCNDLFCILQHQKGLLRIQQASCRHGKRHQTSTAHGQKKRERMPKGIGNKSGHRLNMHLENQIRRAKYINPNCKVMLSQAEKSNSVQERWPSSHTTGFKAGEPAASPSSEGLDLHPPQLPPC